MPTICIAQPLFDANLCKSERTIFFTWLLLVVRFNIVQRQTDNIIVGDQQQKMYLLKSKWIVGKMESSSFFFASQTFKSQTPFTVLTFMVLMSNYISTQVISTKNEWTAFMIIAKNLTRKKYRGFPFPQDRIPGIFKTLFLRTHL